MKKMNQAENLQELTIHDRRAAIRKIMAGTVVLAGCSALPEKWTTPLLEFGALPAHATTSGQQPGYNNEVTIDDSGDLLSVDGILQHKIAFPKVGPQYAQSLLLVWSDGNELYIPDSSKMTLNANKDDARKYQPGGSYSGNNPDIPTMEVYAKRGTHPSHVTLYY